MHIANKMGDIFIIISLMKLYKLINLSTDLFATFVDIAQRPKALLKGIQKNVSIRIVIHLNVILHDLPLTL